MFKSLLAIFLLYLAYSYVEVSKSTVKVDVAKVSKGLKGDAFKVFRGVKGATNRVADVFQELKDKYHLRTEKYDVEEENDQ